ncbi:hypothetical protein B9G55_12635 [Saccharibacillus sp. O16]|nr:hypothetical protein B9G55_12635 [Saccharibacillus sp. O16]
MKIKALFFILFLLLVGCSRAGEEHSNKFKLGNLDTSVFSNQKNYFIVTPFEWVGKKPVTIESVELVTKDDMSINAEQAPIRYTFYGADPKKGVGIYQRDDLGDLEDIQGFELKGEGRLVLKVSMNEVRPDPNRRIKIKYIIGQKKHEQLLESNMIEQLRTEE